MSWFRLDDQFAFHAKVLEAGNEAIGVFCRAGAWSSAHLTEGAIPRGVALTLASKKVWARLVAAKAGHEHGLVEETDDGYVLHHYLDWNPTADEALAKKAARAAAGRLGGQRSGAARREASAKQTRSNCFTDAEANAKQNGTPSPSPSPIHSDHTHTGATEIEDDDNEIDTGTDDVPGPSVDLVAAVEVIDHEGHPLAAAALVATGEDLIALLHRFADEGHKWSIKVRNQLLSQGGRLTEGQKQTLRDHRKELAEKAADLAARSSAAVVELDELGQWISQCWLAARKRQGLPALEAEPKPIAEIARKAAKQAAECEGAWRPTAQDIAAYWIRMYLADTSDRAAAANQQYPLAWLPTRCGAAYGTPTRRDVEGPTPAQRAAVAAEAAPVVFTAAELAANQAAMKAATAAFGGGPGLVSGTATPARRNAS